MPAGARTDRADGAGDPPTVHCVRPPTTQIGSVAPTSSTKSCTRPLDRHSHAPPSRIACCCSGDIANTSPQLDPDGSTLPGFARPIRIEGAAQLGLVFEVVVAELQVHERALFEPDAVFARQHAADCERRLDDLLAGGVHALGRAGLSCVVDEQRMQVAVARVEDVHHEEVVLLRDRVDLLEHLDESRARDHRVVQVVVGLDAGNRTERRLASLPQRGPLGLVGGDANGAGSVARERPR